MCIYVTEELRDMCNSDGTQKQRSSPILRTLRKRFKFFLIFQVPTPTARDGKYA